MEHFTINENSVEIVGKTGCVTVTFAELATINGLVAKDVLERETSDAPQGVA